MFFNQIIKVHTFKDSFQLEPLKKNILKFLSVYKIITILFNKYFLKFNKDQKKLKKTKTKIRINIFENNISV